MNIIKVKLKLLFSYVFRQLKVIHYKNKLYLAGKKSNNLLEMLNS